MKLIDISHYQGMPDFEKVKEDGFKGVIHKCTESTDFQDLMYEINKPLIKENGLIFGAYHFARGGDAEEEAKYFLDNVGTLKKGDLLVLDYEIYTLSDPATWCLKFAKYVKKKTGFKPLFYTYHALLKKYDWTVLSDYGVKLWAARYGKQTQEPNEKYEPATGSFSKYILWQYCSKGSVDGINADVDLNYTKLTKKKLKSYGKK